MNTLQVVQHARVLPKGFIAALQAQFGSRCSVSESARARQGRDESPYSAHRPTWWATRNPWTTLLGSRATATRTGLR